MINMVASEQGSNLLVSQLESIYNRYGAGIYSLCLRLLADQNAAEIATVDVFVRFNKEVSNQFEESRARLRLRELAIEVALRRLRGPDLWATLRWFRSVLVGVPFGRGHNYSKE